MIGIYAERGPRCRLYVEGHAEAGADRDAVCAGVSALTGALLQYADQIGARYLRYDMQRGEVFFSCPRAGAWFELVLQGLSAIAARYPAHVKISVLG